MHGTDWHWGREYFRTLVLNFRWNRWHAVLWRGAFDAGHVIHHRLHPRPHGSVPHLHRPHTLPHLLQRGEGLVSKHCMTSTHRKWSILELGNKTMWLITNYLFSIISLHSNVAGTWLSATILFCPFWFVPSKWCPGELNYYPLLYVQEEFTHYHIRSGEESGGFKMLPPVVTVTDADMRNRR